MENRGRVLSVDFSNAVGRTVKASPLTAIDYGQILEIHGLPLPPSFECHFSKNGATAYKSIGTTTNGIGTVPFVDEQTQSGGIITAYIYLHETADDGETEYRIIIPVESRPGVTPAEPTPVEQDVIAQAISALNNAVTVTTANVGITEANKQATQQSAEEAEADANRADTAWNGAVIAQNSAQASADVASTKATEASQSATTAHSEAQYAHSYAESAHTDAQSASASATSAQASATSAQQSASLAQQYANTATAKASEAMQSAQSASSSASDAQRYANISQTNAEDAESAKSIAVDAQTGAVTAKGLAEIAQASAQESAESAQASADRAEQEADRWYEFLPVDTASGSIAHFTDGAKDVPVKSLSVSLEPIQDLHGQDAPYPAGGSKNLLSPTIYSGGAYNSPVGTVFNLTVSDMQFTALDERTFTISTTASWQAFTLYFPVTQQKYRTSGTISAPTTLRVSKYYLDENFAVLYVSNKSDISQPMDTTWNADTAVDGNARYVAFVFTNASTASETITVTEPMAEVGTTTTTYAPYSNICPITGHTQVVVNRGDGNGGNLQSITIQLGDTVYGGTLDVVNGALTVDRAKIVLDGTQSIGTANWRAYEGSSAWLYVPSITPNRVNTVGRIGAISDTLEEIPYGFSDAPIGDTYIYNGRIGFSSVGSSIYGLAVRVPVSGLTNATLINAYLAENPITVVYPITTPIEIPLTPQQMTTLLGINNVWSDSGDVSVDYRADVQLYIQKMIASALNA